MNALEIINLVKELNARCCRDTEGAVSLVPFKFETDGERWAITFMGEGVADSESPAYFNIDQIKDDIRHELEPWLEAAGNLDLSMLN